MAAFSSTIKVTDLNDFIAPSQACVVNLDGSKIESREIEVGQVKLQPKPSSGFRQTSATKPGDAVKVSLQDCLACSGCVTSAETVLLEQQSTSEFMAQLRRQDVTVVVSMSPQSRASLAALWGLTSAAAFRKLTHFLKQLGVWYVFDITPARDVALMEAGSEFIGRYHTHAAQAGGDSGQPSTSGRVEMMEVDGVHLHSHATANGTRLPSMSSSTYHALPMLASACPGWVCYAEKTHGDYVLPYIATAKSPQAIMGYAVKHLLCQRLGVSLSRLYHTTIMPCYDKKLEAARDDFLMPGSSVPEVDCVLTSVEIAALIESHGVDLSSAGEAMPDSLAGSGVLHSAEGEVEFAMPGGSGGYLEYIYRRAARELFGQSVPPGPLPLRVRRNADFKEISLKVNGQEVLRFAAAYGFRNIQTLMRQIKRGTCPYHYVELMACPSGCLNGGGQLKPQLNQSALELLAQVELTYHQNLHPRMPEDNPEAVALLRELSGVHSTRSELSEHRGVDRASSVIFHTHYHKREKNVTAVIGDW